LRYVAKGAEIRAFWDGWLGWSSARASSTTS
jgi:hypothetical protein